MFSFQGLWVVSTALKKRFFSTMSHRSFGRARWLKFPRKIKVLYTVVPRKPGHSKSGRSNRTQQQKKKMWLPYVFLETFLSLYDFHHKLTIIWKQTSNLKKNSKTLVSKRLISIMWSKGKFYVTYANKYALPKNLSVSCLISRTFFE